METDHMRFDRKKTMTMNWEGLGDEDDDDDRFFETYERMSSAMPLDLGSSSDEEGDFDDCRLSFASTMSHTNTMGHNSGGGLDFRNAGAMSPDYDIWMAAPGSIKERRRRLLNGMGLGSDKNLLKVVSIQRAVSIQRVMPSEVIDKVSHQDHDVSGAKQQPEEKEQEQEQQEQVHQSPSIPVFLIRSRSESEIEKLSSDTKRKEDLLGKISKQRLTRTLSSLSAPRARICTYTRARAASTEIGSNKGHALTSVVSKGRFGAFFLIKNLDTGKEFIVNEYNEDGMWNRLSDLQTGKQLTMEEFEKSVGHSPVVKELMRRENRMNESTIDIGKVNSYLSKSLRGSKRRGAALLKNIKGVATSMTMRANDKEKESNSNNNSPKADQKQNKNTSNNNQWVKVKQTGKSYKELSALHLCQEIQAHEGSIWTIKFSSDAHLLASAGEDRVIHVWEVQECEIMSIPEGSLTPLHPSMIASAEKTPGIGEVALMPSEKKKKGKGSAAKKGNQIPDYVHVPETVFSLSEKPLCSLEGHLDEVLDLSWSSSQLLLSSSMDKTVRLWDPESKSCLKMFAHNDYVTCIQFNPMDDDYFISGSLDAKVRLWSIPRRQVVDWTDLHEMVTAACYTPDGQSALIGSHKGSCRKYKIEDCKLNQTEQIEVKTKGKAPPKKITGFQFSPVNPSEVLVTSADSRIRVLDGLELIHKFRGFRNTSSQMLASYNIDGKYIICASEDSQVYMWRREDHRSAGTAKKTVVTTQSHENFQCKDVSVAIPWHGVVKGEPPAMPVNSKKTSKRDAKSHTSSSNNSPTKEDSSAVNCKKGLPPLPKKNTANHQEPTSTIADEELTHTSHNESENGESLDSESSSTRAGPDLPNSSSKKLGDSPSSSPLHNSCSKKLGDSPSSSPLHNSCSKKLGDSPSSSPLHNSSSKKQGDSPSSSPLHNSSSVKHGDSPSPSSSPLHNSSSTKHGESNSSSDLQNSSSTKQGDQSALTNSSSTKQGDSATSSISSASKDQDPSSISAGSSTSSSWSSSWSWFDINSHGAHSIQPTAWGMVVVTATLGGEIRTYQNFGIPRKLGRQAGLF